MPVLGNKLHTFVDEKHTNVVVLWQFDVNCFTKTDRQTHLFNILFFRTTWVSWHQKGYTSLGFNEARDDGVVVA